MLEVSLKTGDKAPDFKLPNKEGQELSLDSFQGKWIILYFYPKDNTSGCTKEAVEFSEMLEELKAQNAVVIGVSPDSVKSHQKFADKHDLKVELLSDPQHESMEKFGVWGLKKMCGRESMGVIRSTYIINPEGYIAAHWNKVKVKGHAQQVKDAFETLKVQYKG